MIRHAKTHHSKEWETINEKAFNQKTVASYFKQPETPKVEKYPLNSQRQQKINRKLAEFISKDMRPLNIVNGEGFRDLMNELDPSYTLPSVATLRNKLIPKLQNETMTSLQRKFETIEEVSITTDGWTSPTADKYNCYTVHYIDWSENEPVLQSKILECAPFEAEKGNAVELEKETKRVTEKHKITDKVVLAVADNAKDVQKSLKLSGFAKLGCSAHKLNLAAQFGIKNCAEVEKLRTKLTKIVRLVKVSSGAKKTFTNCRKRLGYKDKGSLISYCKTRWNSFYLMVQRAVDMKDALILFFSEFKSKDLEPLNDKDWALMVEILPVMKNLYLVTNELSAEKVTTLSKVVPIVKILTEVYSLKVKESSVAKELRQKVLEGLKKQFDGIEVDDVYSVSAILDPRFKNLVFSNKARADLAIEQAKEIALEIARESDKDDQITETSEKSENNHETIENDYDDFWSNFDTKTPIPKKRAKVDQKKDIIEIEMKNYLQLPKLDRKDCPIKWWKQSGSKKFPYLFKSARKFQVMPATSVPSERVFSNAGYVLNKKRSSLTKSTANNLICLHTNLKK